MQWYNPNFGILPKDGEHVIVSANGVYYPCIYNAEKAIFRVDDAQMEKYFGYDEPNLYWRTLE